MKLAAKFFLLFDPYEQIMDIEMLQQQIFSHA